MSPLRGSELSTVKQCHTSGEAHWRPLLLLEQDPRYAQCTLHAASCREVEVDWADSPQTASELLKEPTARWRHVLIDQHVAGSGRYALLALLAARAQAPLIILVTNAHMYERSIELYRSGGLLVPKPSSGRALIDLVLAMGNMQALELGGEDKSEDLVVGDLVLQSRALITPDARISLRSAEARLLRYLFTLHGRLASTEELAHAIFERRDRSSAMLVRRHVANTRAALGGWAWLIESVPRQGYRVAKSCFANTGPGTHRAAPIRQRA